MIERIRLGVDFIENPSYHRYKRAVKSDMNKTDLPFVDLQVDGFPCIYFWSPRSLTLKKKGKTKPVNKIFLFVNSKQTQKKKP